MFIIHCCCCTWGVFCVMKVIQAMKMLNDENNKQWMYNNNKPTCHETNNEADNPDRVGGKIQFADLSDQ